MAMRLTRSRLPSITIVPLRARTASTIAVEHSSGPPPPPIPFIPMAVPQPTAFTAAAPELPVRVPFLPENDFARYHRHEYVPSVAPPHDPAVSTLINTPESNFTSVTREILSELFATSTTPSGKTEETKFFRMTEEDMKAVEMTEEKKTFLKAATGGAVVWWAFGEPVMRLLGIL